MTTVKEIMNPPLTIERKSSLATVLKKLLDEKKSRLLVSEQEKINGIVSEKDIGLFLLTDTTDRNLDQIPVSELYRDLILVDEKTNLIECAQLLITKGIGSLGIKYDSSVIGIITKTDLVKYYSETFQGKKIVGEYMSPYYAWKYSDTTLNKIVEKMIDDKISRMIIRNRSEKPVGLITFRDLFNMSLKLGKETDLVDNSDPLVSLIFPRRGFLSETGFGGTTKAEEIMSTDIVSVPYDEDLAVACKKLLENNINGLGVLSSRGNLIGIISKTDIVKAMAFMG